MFDDDQADRAVRVFGERYDITELASFRQLEATFTRLLRAEMNDFVSGKSSKTKRFESARSYEARSRFRLSKAQQSAELIRLMQQGNKNL